VPQLSARCTLQFKWPPLLCMFLVMTSVNIWLSQHHTACQLKSTSSNKEITCKNIPWKKFIIWRSRSSSSNRNSGGGSSNVLITWCIFHGQISSSQIIHTEAPTEQAFKNKVPELNIWWEIPVCNTASDGNNIKKNVLC
jgi:hypothetical protein